MIAVLQFAAFYLTVVAVVVAGVLLAEYLQPERPSQMIVLAIVSTVLALVLSVVVVLCNDIAPGSRDFKGLGMLVGVWAAIVLFWLVWWLR